MSLKFVYICSCGETWGSDQITEMEAHLEANRTHTVYEGYTHDSSDGVPDSYPIKSQKKEKFNVTINETGSLNTKAETGSGSRTLSPISIGCNTKGRAYSETRSTSYSAVGQLIFPGTNTGTPLSIKAVVHTNDGRNMDVRIVDVTNKRVLLDVTNIAYKEPVMLNLGVPKTLPKEQALIEIQIRRGSGSKGSTRARVSYFMLEF